MQFGLQGMDMPPTACANCTMMKKLSIVPYMSMEQPKVMIAVIILCELCRLALKNQELGCRLETIIPGEQGSDPRGSVR